MVAKTQPKRQQRPAQSQRRQPGIEAKMRPLPEAIKSEYHSGYKLASKAAIITGGDSGIGRAVAVAFAHACASAIERADLNGKKT